MRRTRALLVTAALSIALTACSSGNDAASDSGADAGADTGSTATAPADAGGEMAGGSVTYTATDSITWETPDQSTSAGSVELTLQCSPSVEHELAIEGVNGDAALIGCAPGESATDSIDLEAGSYTVFCSIAGHRDAGMEGTLSVS